MHLIIPRPLASGNTCSFSDLLMLLCAENQDPKVAAVAAGNDGSSKAAKSKSTAQSGGLAAGLVLPPVLEAVLNAIVRQQVWMLTAVAAVAVGVACTVQLTAEAVCKVVKAMFASAPARYAMSMLQGMSQGCIWVDSMKPAGNAAGVDHTMLLSLPARTDTLLCFC